ncbi:MAG: DUF87 domain-containing protein [Pyrobaculum arsenaticum]|nr:DUF87 domain-containing protein [Pyrobaculum arsenaticum]MCY0891583.1 DUF87 domain-containing protein [Pyrobaculum arsenaticum]NYR15095.1 ATP-binding protein [Pyrobaculum arsenaticum]
MWRLGGGVFVGFRLTGPAFLPLDRHVVIAGSTRSGKTRLAKKIVARARLPAVVLDWHGEYGGVSVDPHLLKISIEGLDKKLLCEILGLALNLNEPSVYFLYRAVRNRELRTLRDVVVALDEFLVSTKSEVEMKAAIARRLEYVIDVFEGGRVPADLVFRSRRVVSVDLSSLKLYEERVLVILFVLASLYNYLFSRGIAKGVERLLVIDEAQNVLRRGDVVKHLVFESGKYGLRVVFVTNEMPPPEILVHSTLVVTRPHRVYNLEVRGSALLRDDSVERIWIV